MEWSLLLLHSILSYQTQENGQSGSLHFEEGVWDERHFRIRIMERVMQWMASEYKLQIRLISLEIVAMIIQLDQQLLDPFLLGTGIPLLKKYLDINDLDLVVKTLYHLVLLIESVNYDDNQYSSINNLSMLRFDLKQLVYEVPFQKQNHNNHINNQLKYIQTAVNRILKFIDDNDQLQYPTIIG